MIRSMLVVVFAAGLLICSAGQAQEITRLTATDTAKVARTAEPVTNGVPLPKGLVKDVKELSLTADGKAVPASFSVLNKWPDDGSVRWALLDTQLDVPAGGSVTLSLVKGAAAPVAKPVAVTDAADTITVDTGAVKFTVSKKGFKLFDSLEMGGTKVLVAPTGGLTASVDGQSYSTAADKDSVVTVEEKTDMRVALLAKGKMTSASGKTSFDYEVRIHAYAGSPEIKVVATIINKFGNRNDPNKVRDLSVELALSPGNSDKPMPCKYAFGTDEETPAAGDVTTSAWLNVRKSDSYELGGDASGSGKCKSTKPLTLGWGDVSQNGVGVAAGVRRFWQNFPKAIEAKPGELIVHLYPSMQHSPVEVYTGMARTHEVLIVPHVGATKPAELQAKFVAFQKPLYAFPSPKWMCDSGALGSLAESAEIDPKIYGPYADAIKTFDLKMDDIFTQLAGPQQDHWQKRGVTMDTYGWLSYGDTLHWVWQPSDGVNDPPGSPWTIAWDSNYYDMPEMALIHFVRTGHADVFDFFVDHSWHLMDVDVIHYLPGADNAAGGGSRRCPATNHMGFDPPHHKEVSPNYSFDHHKSESLFNRYYFLGDRWAMESAEELLNHAFNPKANGGKNGNYLGTRHAGHQILTLVAGYWFSGDKKYLAKAREVVDAGLERQKKWDGALNYDEGKKQGVAQFTDGILAESWCKYYQVTGEKDVLDGVTALVKFLSTADVSMGARPAAGWGNPAMAAGLVFLKTGDEAYAKMGLACLEAKPGHLSKDSADMFRNAGFFCGLLADKVAEKK